MSEGDFARGFVLAGAALGGPAWAADALLADVTSLAFHPLSAADAADPDRDGDGLSLADELFVHGTDPDMWDTDGDGLSDDGCGGCDGDCADGNCDALEGPSLGSLKFRVPLGAPVKGQVAGFAWFATDGPISVSRSAFRLLAHPDAHVSDTDDGAARRIACSDPRGRDLRIADVADGVRITVLDAAARTLEHTWEIANVDGDPARIRLRKVSRLGNVMSDETYACADGEWTRTDNVSGAETRRETSGDLGAGGTGRCGDARLRI